MKRILTLLTAFVLMSALSVKAAMFTPSPAPLQESSKNVVITFDATESGVAGLQGLSTDLYAHIGVYTNLSPDKWAYTSTWGDNAEKYKLKRTASNQYQISLGDLRTYFGITNANEHISKICIIARNSAGSVQTADQFIDVYPEGLYVSLTASPSNTTITKATSFTFTASSTQAATLKIYVDDKEVKSASNATSLTYTQNFSTPGVQNNVKAVATNSNGTKEATLPVLYVKSSESGTYPGGVPKQGAVKNADGSVTFCIAAPGKSSVIIVGSWDNYEALASNTMKYQDYNGFRYFWITVKGLDNSTYYPYYYLVDGQYKVSDPYAHLVLDHLSDKWLEDDVFADRPAYPYSQFDDTMLAVYKGDMHDTYKWKVNNFELKNKDALVIYELLIRDFTGTSEKADGTIRLAIDKIPYLYELGVSAVELMPVMEFDGNNSWGYNTNSYMALDKAYGSPDDLKEFVDKCHEKGIAVILDIVFNHTPGLHPWYAMYDAGKSPFYNATCPHDYGVYEDIKQEYGLVEQHWVDVLTHWLTNYKVDGFRFDLVKGLGNNDSYKNSSEAATNAFNQSRVDRMARLHEAMREVNPDAYFINELLGDAKEENEMAKDGELNWMNVNDPGCEFAMGWLSKSNLNSMWATKAGRTAGSTVAYLESHDEQRLAYKQNEWGAEGVKGDADVSCRRLSSAAAQMLMVPGSHMIWMFSEMGNAQSTKKANGENNTDPKIVDWALMDQPANAELLKRYQELIHLRTEHSVLFSEAATFALSFSGTGMRYATSKYGDAEFYLFVNGALEEKSIEKKLASTDASNYEIVSQSQGPDPVIDYANNKVTLAGGAYVVIMNKTALSGVEDVALDSNALSISVVDGRLVVAGAQASVDVWSVAGMKVAASNGDLDVTLPEGMYIVRSGSKTVKVLVK